MQPSSPKARADRAFCRAAIRDGSRSFYAASLLLPRRLRAPAYGLYAFCRLSDDAMDLRGGDAESLARLRARLDLIYAGRPAAHPADRALADVVAHYRIPRALPDGLLEGFAWDAEGRRYETLSDLQAYAARVAGAVGAMMSLIMGARSHEALARACDLGVAMQLTNIARDVGEDARAGRLYLPLQWMRDAGLAPEMWLAKPVFDARLARVVKRLLDVAEQLYARGESGVAHLPRDCRPAIRAASLIYAEIGRTLARRGCDSVSVRTRVAASQKAALLWRALASPDARLIAAPPLRETQFLVEAVHDTREFAGPSTGWRAQLVKTIDLFERLAQRDSMIRQT